MGCGASSSRAVCVDDGPGEGLNTAGAVHKGAEAEEKVQTPAAVEEATFGKASPTVRAVPAAVPILNTSNVERNSEPGCGGVITRKKLSEPKVVKIATNHVEEPTEQPRKAKKELKKREVFNSASKRMPSVGGKALILEPLGNVDAKRLDLPVVGGKKQPEKEWRKKHDDFLQWVRENKKSQMKQPEDEPADVVIENKQSGLICSDFC